MCHVLIIEDEPVIAEMLCDILEAEGATSFDIAATEERAVAAARAVPPDFILSDVRLACGTGPAAVQQILRALGPIPVLFATGTPWECGPVEPPARIVAKPFSLVEVAAAFRELAFPLR